MRGLLTLALLLTLLTAGCGGRKAEAVAEAEEGPRYELPDTLRVATLYSPGSYFIYREQVMGYDYDLVSEFARDKGVALDIEVATSLGAAIEMLDSGRVDLVAYEVPVTAEFHSRVLPCGPENITTQVLVQKTERGKPRITDVTELPGRDIWVVKGSKYEHRLHNLNDEVGGGIRIHTLERESLLPEDLIEMVNSDSIELTVVDSDIARINKTYYRNIDVSLQMSFAQRSSWAVLPDNRALADTINAWLGSEKPRKSQLALLKRYYEVSKAMADIFIPDFKKGEISPFDHLFRRYAAQMKGLDWRLLAAMGYVESRFDSTVVSWAGARGVMQLMPSTARAYGVPDSLMSSTGPSIEASVKVYKALEQNLIKRVPDPTERRKFVLAAYNSGLAHILDAIAIARKYGLNPRVWDGNVADALMMKSNPEVYNDSVCKYGYFRGRETFEYVRQVMAFYNKAIQSVKQ